jgi:hypothetical protein
MRGNCLWDMFADTQSGKMRYGLIRCTGTRKCKVLKTAARRIESEVPKKRIAMSMRTASPSAREAFGCTGEQLDALVQFARERGLEDQPFQLVVLEWSRVVTLVRSLNLLRQTHRK